MLPPPYSFSSGDITQSFSAPLFYDPEAPVRGACSSGLLVGVEALEGGDVSPEVPEGPLGGSQGHTCGADSASRSSKSLALLTSHSPQRVLFQHIFPPAGGAEAPPHTCLQITLHPAPRHPSGGPPCQHTHHCCPRDLGERSLSSMQVCTEAWGDYGQENSHLGATCSVSCRDKSQMPPAQGHK